MLQFNPAMQSVSSLTDIASSTPAESYSLDSRMTAELARQSGMVGARQEGLLALAQSAMTDPQGYSRLQANVADFQVQMSVCASLGRKAVGAIETLVKS